MGMFDVDDLTNKIDVGSKPGTLWSLSSQKPGHGIAELRDPDITKLWQSDGLLPHLINIQFAQKTALTHISLYMDFKLDDSYTPNKVRIYAGTHYHDLVEVRTREFNEASGWKHFVLDKFDDVAESDESSVENSSEDSMFSSDDEKEGLSFIQSSSSREDPARTGNKNRAYICILANHAAGKDSHLRGIRIFGPPTHQSRDKARSNIRKLKESRRITGARAAKQRKDREIRQRTKAFYALRSWAQDEDHQGPSSSREGHDGSESLPVSDRLRLLSSVR